MKKIKRSFAIAGLVAVIGLTSVAGMRAASAQSGSTDPADSLVEKISQKFHLNKNEVQAVFDEERAAHEAKMQSRMEDRLDQAVQNGKITTDQKDKIIAKLKELRTQMESEFESMKDKTSDERRTLMEQRRAELEKWAKHNNIPVKYLHLAKGHGRHGPDGPRDEDQPKDFSSSDEQSMTQ